MLAQKCSDETLAITSLSSEAGLIYESWWVLMPLAQHEDYEQKVGEDGLTIKINNWHV